MEIEFSLSRADFISFQLFAATKSVTITKSKRKARNRLPIVYLILGTILLTLEDKVYAIIFYLIGILWYLLYPTLTKKRYAKHYEKYVDENFELKDEVYEGFAARVIQHEYDHIDGILFVDHLAPLKKRLLKGKLNAISKGKVNVSYRIKLPK